MTITQPSASANHRNSAALPHQVRGLALQQVMVWRVRRAKPSSAFQGRQRQALSAGAVVPMAVSDRHQRSETLIIAFQRHLQGDPDIFRTLGSRMFSGALTACAEMMRRMSTAVDCGIDDVMEAIRGALPSNASAAIGGGSELVAHAV